MRPRTSRGIEWRIEERKRWGNAVRWAVVVCIVERALSRERAETTPAEKTKDPTPRSIKEVPQFSTLAKRRGKTGKSTARIARQVTTIMAPR